MPAHGVDNTFSQKLEFRVPIMRTQAPCSGYAIMYPRPGTALDPP